MLETRTNYMHTTSNNLGGPLRATGVANAPQCIAKAPPREIPDEIRTLHIIIEDLDKLVSRLVERLDPISCHTPQPCEQNQEPPPNKTSCGQSIREARTKIANVCSRLSEQLEALEL